MIDDMIAVGGSSGGESKAKGGFILRLITISIIINF